MEIEKGDIIQVAKLKVKSIMSEPKEYMETYVVGRVWGDGNVTAVSTENGEVIVLRREQYQFRVKGGEYLKDRLFNSGGF